MCLGATGAVRFIRGAGRAAEKAHSELIEEVITCVRDKKRRGLTMIRSGIVNVNDCGADGATPLLAACYAQWLPGVMALLRLGADAHASGGSLLGVVDAAVLGGADRAEEAHLRD